jgi:DNA-binding NtrC family response regulator
MGFQTRTEVRPHRLVGRDQLVRSIRVEVVTGPDAGLAVVGDQVTVGTARDNGVVVADPTVSRYHLELSPVHGGVQVVDLGSTNGTFAGPVRIERAIVPVDTALQIGGTQLRVSDAAAAKVEIHAGDALAELRAKSPVMRRLFASIDKVARGTAATLVTGESGTGKELIARAIHTLGARAAMPFVTVDCGALATNLIASELFGHERGSFTGADRQRLGAFERAHGGTVFLDEIGELPAADQAALLGVLERRKFRRVGGSEDIAVDVRVVSATHRDLRAEVNAGRFRLDLYYRLAVVVLKVPPLRERADDIPLLVEHFLRTLGHTGPIEAAIPEPMMTTLLQHAWPGNVRELRNAVEAILTLGVPAEPFDAPAQPIDADRVSAVIERPYKYARTVVMRDFEHRYFSRLLERAEGNISAAARLAEIDRSYLIDLLRRSGVRGDRD